MVAYTDIAVTVHESERAYQWGTLVRTDHRGHRLGLAVKVANLRLLQETHPQITTVVTFNADVNAPMVAVNERLGFVPVQWMGEPEEALATVGRGGHPLTMNVFPPGAGTRRSRSDSNHSPGGANERRYVEASRNGDFRDVGAVGDETAHRADEREEAVLLLDPEPEPDRRER